eukprot:5280042-Pleurochrysis_carterae.AAC.1
MHLFSADNAGTLPQAALDGRQAAVLAWQSREDGPSMRECARRIFLARSNGPRLVVYSTNRTMRKKNYKPFK